MRTDRRVDRLDDELLDELCTNEVDDDDDILIILMLYDSIHKYIEGDQKDERKQRDLHFQPLSRLVRLFVASFVLFFGFHNPNLASLLVNFPLKPLRGSCQCCDTKCIFQYFCYVSRGKYGAANRIRTCTADALDVMTPSSWSIAAANTEAQSVSGRSVL